MYGAAKATRMRRTPFELIVIVIVIARMARNVLRNEHEPCQMVNSYSFGSRFGTVRLGHYGVDTRRGWPLEMLEATLD